MRTLRITWLLAILLSVCGAPSAQVSIVNFAEVRASMQIREPRDSQTVRRAERYEPSVLPVVETTLLPDRSEDRGTVWLRFQSRFQRPPPAAA